VAETKVISVLSGKGGVGKSILAFNLADQLTALGFRTLLVDADFSSGSLHVLANVGADRGVNEYLTGALPLSEAVVAVRGVDLLAATWNAGMAEERSVEQTALLCERLRAESGAYDFVIFDHSSGRSNQAVLMAHASDLNLLVVIPELTSLADGYGLFKQIIAANRKINCGLVVNRTQSDEEADYIQSRMVGMAETFLRQPVGYLGHVSEDVAVRQAVASQLSLAQAAPQSRAAQQILALTQAISSSPSIPARLSKETASTQINKTAAIADIRG
jgi:flagellar biosynthesis protein FlhG